MRNYVVKRLCTLKSEELLEALRSDNNEIFRLASKDMFKDVKFPSTDKLREYCKEALLR